MNRVTFPGGYAETEFSVEFRRNLEIQAALEGVAARLVAEQAIPEEREELLRPIRSCLAAIDRILNKPTSVSAFTEYVGLNAGLHRMLLQLSRYAVLDHHVCGEIATPFRIPDILPAVRSDLDLFRRIMFLEQEHHRSIAKAIEHGHGSRAEDLVRNHWLIATGQLARARSVLAGRTHEHPND